MKKLVCIVFGICCSTLLWAQSVEEIKADRGMYLWGEGRGNTLKKADSEALSDLINQITTTIESDFTLLQEEKSESDYKETVKSVIRTYSNATLSNTERIVIENEPDARVFRYMKRSEIDKIFKARKNKILEYLANAETAEENLQIADALRYYYWSQTLLRSHPEGATIRYRDQKGEERLPATWIPLKINTIFSHLNIAISRIIPEGNFQTIELNILYNSQPVRNFDYTYWDGRDWSNIVSAKDGRGIAELPALADAAHLRIKGEYIFDGEATVDAELKDVINKLDVVPFRSCYIEAYKPDASSVPVQQQIVSGSNEQAGTGVVASFFKPAPDSERYLAVIKKVEKAVRERNYEGLKNYFTPEGYAIFNQLIRYGQARIVGTPDYRLVKCEEGIFCRSLPLSFHFENNNRTFVEDVVFDFSKDAKIQGLSFGLSQSALADIVSKKDWSERSRMILIRFLENYKTAYALKRLDYIESIFAEDALIIVGTVLKKQTVTERQVTINRPYIRYTRQTKEQYIKRLRSTFTSNEFINLRFADNVIRKSADKGEIYGVQIRQDYFSSNYGDSGYLFLLVDLNHPDKPIIHVRAWQPEKDPDFGLIDLPSFTF